MKQSRANTTNTNSETAMERAMRNAAQKTAQGKGTVTVQRGAVRKTVKRGETQDGGQYVTLEDGGAKFSRPICPVIVFAEVQPGDAVETQNSKGEKSVQTVLCVLSSGTVQQQGDHLGDPFTKFIAVPTPKEKREKKTPAREIMSQTQAELAAMRAEQSETQTLLNQLLRKLAK